MTSNVGSDLVLRDGRMGFGDASGEDSFARTEQEILDALRQTFRPEFLNRIDEIIVFNSLGSEELRSITGLLIEDINVALLEKRLRVEVNAEAQEWLLQKAETDPASGARPLRRTIQRYLQDPISDILIQGHSAEFELIEVSVEDERLDFKTCKGALAAEQG
jgi:ATP-dependent Clp protease ATP-binding subunit ClpA